jgi:hypothetical protein
VLLQDVSGEPLRAGDVGVVVRRHPAQGVVPDGYEVEFFAGTGETVAVVSLPAKALRAASAAEVLGARGLPRA